MIRRRAVRLSVVALAAVAATGCTTFSDNDAVARVGDVELTSDEFAERTAIVAIAQGQRADAADPFRVEGDTARVTVANWIALQLIAGEGILDRYANGVDDLAIACVFAFAAVDAPTAQAIVEELEGGAGWDDVFAREVPDAASAPARGRQQCLGTAADPVLAGQFAGMSPDDPYRVVDSQGVPFVVRAQSETELLGFDLLNALSASDAELAAELFTEANEVDVHVDTRIGVYNPADLSVVAVN